MKKNLTMKKETYMFKYNEIKNKEILKWKKKIWILNHYAGDMYLDRGGRHHWISKELLSEGYNPTIFAANTIHNRNESINIKKGKHRNETVENVSYVFIKTSEYKGNGFSRILNIINFYRNLKSHLIKKIKQNDIPDIIYASVYTL